MRPIDTSAEADRVQFELLRRATPARRATLARSLSTTTMQLTRRALRKQRPEATEPEIDLAFVELCYGRELAERLRPLVIGRSA